MTQPELREVGVKLLKMLLTDVIPMELFVVSNILFIPPKLSSFPSLTSPVIFRNDFERFSYLPIIIRFDKRWVG